MLKKKGIVFWITGLSGSGKSTIGNLIYKYIEKKYGPTIIIHGDDIRRIYKFKNFNYDSRLKLAKNNSDFCKLLINQKINVIFTTVGLIHEVYDYNRKNFGNSYIEIFIKSNFKNLVKRKNKPFYKKKNSKNVIGKDIIPEFPKKPDIILINNFKNSIKTLSKELFLKIQKVLN